MSEGRNVHKLPRELLQEAHGSSGCVRVVGRSQPLLALQRYRPEDATFPLDCGGLANGWREESRRYSTPTPDLPRLDSYSFEWITGRFVHKGFDVYPSSPAAPARRLGGRRLVAVATALAVALLQLPRLVRQLRNCQITRPKDFIGSRLFRA